MARHTRKNPRTVTVELPPDDGLEDAPPLSDADAARLAEAERITGVDQESPESLAEIDEAEDGDFFRGLEEIRGTVGVVFQVVRTEPHEKAGFCWEYPASQFSRMTIAKKWGPGTYRIRVIGPNRRMMKGGGTIKIADLPEGADAEPGPESTPITDVLAILRADKEKSNAQVKEWVAILAPLVAPMIGNLFAPKKSEVAELVGALASLQQLTPRPEKPETVDTQLDRVASIMGKLKEMAGESGTQTGATWIDLVRDALSGAKPLLESVALKMAAGRSVPPLVPAILPGPALSAPGVSAESAPIVSPTTPVGDPGASNGSESMFTLLNWWRSMLETLIVQAARDRDPELYAEVTLDNVPLGEDFSKVLPYLERADWWAMLAAFNPQVTPYQGWFTSYRAALLALVREGQEATTPQPQTPEPDSGNDL